MFPAVGAGVIDVIKMASAAIIEAGSGLVEFLLRDDFVTTESAPLTDPRTCEPGPGALDLTDTGNNLSISGEQLVKAGHNGIGDPGAWSNLIVTRLTGIAALYKFKTSSVAFQEQFGFDDNKVGSSVTTVFDASGSVFSYYDAALNGISVGGGLANSTEYMRALIMRTDGGFGLIKGGIYTDWTIVYVGGLDNGDRYMCYSSISGGAGLEVDFYRLAQLGYPWNVAYGIATERLAGDREPGDLFIHEADGEIEFVVTTLPS